MWSYPFEIQSRSPWCPLIKKERLKHARMHAHVQEEARARVCVVSLLSGLHVWTKRNQASARLASNILQKIFKGKKGWETFSHEKLSRRTFLCVWWIPFCQMFSLWRTEITLNNICLVFIVTNVSTYKPSLQPKICLNIKNHMRFWKLLKTSFRWD